MKKKKQKKRTNSRVRVSELFDDDNDGDDVNVADVDDVNKQFRVSLLTKRVCLCVCVFIDNDGIGGRAINLILINNKQISGISFNTCVAFIANNTEYFVSVCVLLFLLLVAVVLIFASNNTI